MTLQTKDRGNHAVPRRVGCEPLRSMAITSKLWDDLARKELQGLRGSVDGKSRGVGPKDELVKRQVNV